MAPLCWERLRTGYIHLVLRQKGWRTTRGWKTPQQSRVVNTWHQPASTWVTQIWDWSFFACTGKTAQASFRSTTVPTKAFHPCMAQISAEKSFEGKACRIFMARHPSSQYMPPSIQKPVQSTDTQTWEETWKTYCIEHWSWEHGSKITCLETWAGKIEAEPPLTGKTLSSSFADWAAPRFFAPSFGARFPVCTAFAAHPAQGLFNMGLPQHFKPILLAEPASAYMSSRMQVLQALAQEVVLCY